MVWHLSIYSASHHTARAFSFVLFRHASITRIFCSRSTTCLLLLPTLTYTSNKRWRYTSSGVVERARRHRKRYKRTPSGTFRAAEKKQAWIDSPSPTVTSSPCSPLPHGQHGMAVFEKRQGRTELWICLWQHVCMAGIHTPCLKPWHWQHGWTLCRTRQVGFWMG